MFMVLVCCSNWWCHLTGTCNVFWHSLMIPFEVSSCLTGINHDMNATDCAIWNVRHHYRCILAQKRGTDWTFPARCGLIFMKIWKNWEWIRSWRLAVENFKIWSQGLVRLYQWTHGYRGTETFWRVTTWIHECAQHAQPLVNSFIELFLIGWKLWRIILVGASRPPTRSPMHYGLADFFFFFCSSATLSVSIGC